MKKFEVVESSVLYSGRIFNLRRDKIRLGDGRKVLWDVIEHHGAVTVFPMDSDGNIWLVRQYRHPAGIEMLELPAGMLEPGEDPDDCAARELREEIGMGAKKLQKLGGFYPVPGYSTEYIHVYLAMELYPDALPQDDDEDIDVVKVSMSELDRMLADGELQDAKTIAVLSMVRQVINGGK